MQEGTLPDFLLSEDAGRFYCNALGNFLEGQFFLHLSGLNDPSERAAFWARYSKFMIAKGHATSVEDLGYASAQDNFEAACRFLTVVRDFRVQ